MRILIYMQEDMQELQELQEMNINADPLTGEDINTIFKNINNISNKVQNFRE